jgi:glutamate synthase domain-containing protein 3
MTDDVTKSIKLNRNLSKNLAKAIELDRAIKIGWGAQGDAKPKEGEIGIASFLPKGARVRLLGNLGDFTAFCCQGGTFTLEGNALGWFGAFSSDGRLVVERDAGVRCGHGMTGGRMFCQGSVGDEAGAMFAGGTLVVRGHAGQRTGLGMNDGTIVVIGDCQADAGQGMTGGRIIVDGRCLPEGEGAQQRSLTKTEHKEINLLLKEHDLSVSEDAVVIEADESHAIPSTPPMQTVWGDFGEIGLISGEIAIDSAGPIDVVTLLTRGEEDEGVVFPLPILPELQSGKGLSGNLLSVQPCLVDADPRGIDLVRIGKSNLTEAITLLPTAAGFVFDLDELPSLHDGEVLALMTGLRSHLGDEKPVLIAGRVDRVANLHRMLKEQPIDGVLVRLTSGAGMTAPAALPRIGLSARDAGVSESLHILDIPWGATADDAAIAAAAGCGIIRANPFATEEDAPGTQKARAEAVENWLAEFAASLRGRLTDMGIDALEKLNRRHLRALEHDTAAQSGLRLAGYDRPLPQWMGQ